MFIFVNLALFKTSRSFTVLFPIQSRRISICQEQHNADQLFKMTLRKWRTHRIFGYYTRKMATRHIGIFCCSQRKKAEKRIVRYSQFLQCKDTFLLSGFHRNFLSALLCSSTVGCTKVSIEWKVRTKV